MRDRPAKSPPTDQSWPTNAPALAASPRARPLAIAAQCPHDPRVVVPGEEVNEMVVELPPGYQPSADEEFMNPKQVEYFSRRLKQSRADLRRELDAIPPPEAYDITQEGDQTDHASAASEREFALQNAERIQRLMRQTERALSKLVWYIRLLRGHGRTDRSEAPYGSANHIIITRSPTGARRSNRLTSLHGRAARVCFPRPAYCDARLGPTSVAPPSTTRT